MVDVDGKGTIPPLILVLGFQVFDYLLLYHFLLLFLFRLFLQLILNQFYLDILFEDFVLFLPELVFIVGNEATEAFKEITKVTVESDDVFVVCKGEYLCLGKILICRNLEFSVFVCLKVKSLYI